jgi:hypothetical protein
MNTLEIYREARSFALEQGFTFAEAVEYAHEITKREREEAN